MTRHILFYIFALLAAAIGCVSPGPEPTEFTETVYEPVHAAGFRILRVPGSRSTLLEVSRPWQGADSVKRLLFIGRGGETPPPGVMAIDGAAARIICMSTSQIGLLDAFDATGTVVGVSGAGFVSNPRLRARVGSLADVGFDGTIDYERLLSVRPDVVLLYGVNGASPLEEKLDELGVPYAYIGEYLEDTPLGRAEWIVALGEITGRRAEAEAAFAPIAAAYDSIATLAASRLGGPSVMLNAPYSDVWFMPPSDSYFVRLISDAGGRYVYQADNSGVSRPIDIELAARLLDEADLWLQPGQARSLDELSQLAPKVSFSGPVYNSVADFWESGVARPDLVLNDLSEIMRGDSVLTYFYRLK